MNTCQDINNIGIIYEFAGHNFSDVKVHVNFTLLLLLWNRGGVQL